MKKSTALRYLMPAILLASVSATGNAKSNVPEEASSVINLSLEEGQAKLQQNGYEIAGSSFFGGTQLWWNESKKVCIEIEFDGSGEKKITSVAPGDEQECIKGAAASRKVWDSYRDGKAPASTAALNAERSKLSGAGYTASYWIDDVAPGKDAETWYNADLNKCMRIIWNSKDNQNIKTSECKPEQGKNPAPKKN